MNAAVIGGAATLDRMPNDKKKPASGKHTTKRQNIGVSDDWHAVIRALAAKQKMVVSWYVLDLVAAKADEVGLDRPQLPWEAEGGEQLPATSSLHVPKTATVNADVRLTVGVHRG
jgi:hypothetical protein